MASYHYPLLAREGWPYLGAAVVTALSCHWLDLLPVALLAWLAAGLVLFLFRDPPRRVPPLPLAVVSPLDARVEEVTPDHDPFIVRDGIRVSLRIAPMGVFSVRSPIEGKVVRQWYPNEENAVRLRSDSGPVYAQWIRSDEGDEVVMALETNILARRPYCLSQSGERIGQGERCGYLPVGSRIDVFLPENCRVAVKRGDRVVSGVSVLATLVHK